MSGQAISLATKGIICCGTQSSQTVIQRFCMPLNFSIAKNIIKLNLSQPLPAKINMKNLNIANLTIKAAQTNLSMKASTIKINVNRICD